MTNEEKIAKALKWITEIPENFTTCEVPDLYTLADDYGRLKHENQQLKAELADLRSQLSDAEDRFQTGEN